MKQFMKIDIWLYLSVLNTLHKFSLFFFVLVLLSLFFSPAVILIKSQSRASNGKRSILSYRLDARRCRCTNF